MNKFVAMGLPWVLCLALGVMAYAFRAGQQNARAEVERLQQDNERLVAEVESEQETAEAAQRAEVERLRRDNAELYKLRNEVNLLRQEKQQWSQQAQELQTLRAQLEQQRQTHAETLRRFQSETQQIQSAAAELFAERAAVSSANACINNLRRIDGTKNQWALENAAEVNTLVQVEDLLPYLKGQFPACPEGGEYTLGVIGAPPTCSHPAHALSE